MRDFERRMEKVPEIAEHFGISRSLVRLYVATDNCPCGSPGVNPCWRMGGEAECIVIDPKQAGAKAMTRTSDA